MHKHTKQI
jgi:hypothetical protein